MTALVDVVNRALQFAGTRTNVSATELANNSSNEAIQANLIVTQFRDQLLRMAPWDCALNTKNLDYITSIPGTPENQGTVTSQWLKGQPSPPWAYEYQYPLDCLRACWVTPNVQSSFAGGIPITTAVTGGSVINWTGPAAKFKIAIDQFYCVTALTPGAGGTGYAVGDFVRLAQPSYTFYDPGTQTEVTYNVGTGAMCQVTGVSGTAITTIVPMNHIQGEATPFSGSYFSIPSSGSIAADPNNGIGWKDGIYYGFGSGATFNATFSSRLDQRVILTNQEFAALNYVRQVLDPNVMDPQFIEAWAAVLGARLAIQLNANIPLANSLIALANRLVEEARKVDGNEGLTVNDVTPDFIRIRGIDFPMSFDWSPNQSFDWGGFWPSYS